MRQGTRDHRAGLAVIAARAKWIVVVTVGVLVTAACSGTSADETTASGAIRVRIASYHDPKTATVKTLDWWASEVEKRTHGQVKFQRFYSASLLDETEIRDGTAAGQVEIGHFAPGYHPGDFPLTEGLHMVPGVTTNFLAHMEAVQDLYETNEATQAEWNDQGLHLIHTMTASEGALGTDKPIHTLNDLAGMDIRGYEGGGLNAGLEAVGANPVNLDFGELYEATQRGVVDGFLGLIIDGGVGLGLQETTSHWTATGFGPAASTSIAANLQWWESLPEDIRDVMMSTADEIPQHYAHFVAEAEDAACEKLARAGVKVDALPASERQRWYSLIKDQQLQEWTSEAEGRVDDPQAYLERYRQLVKKYEAQYPLGDYGVQRCMK
jgi:TRAP-type C4-dicarboxylate transport system substrate-binding protein